MMAGEGSCEADGGISGARLSFEGRDCLR